MKMLEGKKKNASLSLMVKIIAREMRTAFPTVQASSSKLLTWSESESESECEMAPALKYTSNSHGRKAILQSVFLSWVHDIFPKKKNRNF